MSEESQEIVRGTVKACLGGGAENASGLRLRIRPERLRDRFVSGRRRAP